jgi:hypothetical protein
MTTYPFDERKGRNEDPKTLHRADSQTVSELGAGKAGADLDRCGINGRRATLPAGTSRGLLGSPWEGTAARVPA